MNLNAAVLEKELLDRKLQLLRIKRVLWAYEHRTLVITEHAYTRYRERIAKIRKARIKELLLHEDIVNRVYSFGNGYYLAGDAVLIVHELTIITVLHKDYNIHKPKPAGV